MEDQYAYTEMFQISVEDFETVLMHINDFTSLQEIKGGHLLVLSEHFSFVESFKN